MRVALVTRVGIEGDWEYARNLIDKIREEQHDIDITAIQPQSIDNMRTLTRDFDVVHFNFVFGFQITSPGDISSFGSKRVVLTFHENNPTDNMSTHQFLRECAAVVVHEKNPHGFIHIPQAIPVVNPCKWSLTNDGIGTAGFPFADKNIEGITEAAAMLRDQGVIKTMNLVLPHSGHANTWAMKAYVDGMFPGANYVTDFVTQDVLLDVLSKNLVNVYAPNSRRLGPSGSVRLGLATGGYVVLNRSAMFRDLFEYEDEIEFIEGDPWYTKPSEIADAVNRVIANGKRPKRVLEDGSLSRCAALYAQVYRSIA